MAALDSGNPEPATPELQCQRPHASQRPEAQGTAMAKKQSKDDDSTKTNGNEPTDEPIQVPPQAGAMPATGETRAPEGAQLTVLAQYMKDLSFESPGAPQTLQGPGQNPQLKVSINVNAAPRAEETYEVALHIEVHAKSDAGVIYNVDLVFGGLFRLRNISQNLLQPVLFVDCPTLLFPFLRRVLADVIRDGGFPPLMLDPIDFGRLYAQNLSRQQSEAQPQAKN
jgi:preprotein translocase subunit SecB